jgi:hypothetical protein
MARSTNRVSRGARFCARFWGAAALSLLAAPAACSSSTTPLLDAASSVVDVAPREAGSPPGELGTWGDGLGPRVSFLSPADGSTVSNPVKFVVAARGVEDVEIVVDQVTHLGSPWDPSQKSSLLYRFSGTGKPRAIHLSGRIAGKEVASDDITITVSADSCADRFFVAKFDADNTDSTGKLDMTALREAALVDVKAAVATLQACGAKVTVGGMMSLLYFESGLALAAYNTKCIENSYYKMSSGCDVYPKALYSYQFGLGAIHTSNFHPCAGTYTTSMRKKLLASISAAGFSVASSLVTSDVQSKVASFCGSGTTATAVDYYILGAHALFGVPKNSGGNALASAAVFPFFTASVSVGATFAELAASCSSITSDESAISVFGGSSSYYSDPAVQKKILGTYKSYAAANCT